MLYSSIPEALLAARVRRGMTQDAAARKFRCDTYTYLRWENGKVIPQARWLPQMATFAGLPLRDLLGLYDQARSAKAATKPAAVA